MSVFWSNAFTVILFVVGLGLEVGSDDDPGKGLGEKYEWHPFKEGLKLSKESGKPLMLIIHKSWCGACKAFKPKFAASSEALELSQHFVMVNTLDNEEPKDAQYKPDGGYIPRIFFLGSEGEVRQEIYNEGGNPKYKFYYSDDKTVVKSMKKAIEILSPAAATSESMKKPIEIISPAATTSDEL